MAVTKDVHIAVDTCFISMYFGFLAALNFVKLTKLVRPAAESVQTEANVHLRVKSAKQRQELMHEQSAKNELNSAWNMEMSYHVSTRIRLPQVWIFRQRWKTHSVILLE